MSDLNAIEQTLASKLTQIAGLEEEDDDIIEVAMWLAEWFEKDLISKLEQGRAEAAAEIDAASVDDLVEVLETVLQSAEVDLDPGVEAALERLMQ